MNNIFSEDRQICCKCISRGEISSVWQTITRKNITHRNAKSFTAERMDFIPEMGVFFHSDRALSVHELIFPECALLIIQAAISC
jgi:hypothetical protein